MSEVEVFSRRVVLANRKEFLKYDRLPLNITLLVAHIIVVVVAICQVNYQRVYWIYFVLNLSRTKYRYNRLLCMHLSGSCSCRLH